MKKKWACSIRLVLAVLLLAGCTDGEVSSGEGVTPLSTDNTSTEGAYVESRVDGHRLQHVTAMYSSPAGEVVISGLDGNGIPAAQSWEEANGTWKDYGTVPNTELLPSDIMVNAVVTGDDAWWIVTTGEDLVSGLYLLAGGRSQAVSLPVQGMITSLAYDVSGAVLVDLYEGDTKHSLVLDAATGAVMATPVFQGFVAVMHAGNGKFAVHLVDDGSIGIHSSTTGEQMETFKFEHKTYMGTAFAFTETGLVAVTGQGLKAISAQGTEDIPTIGANAYTSALAAGVVVKDGEYWVAYMAGDPAMVCRYTYSENATIGDMLRVWSMDEQYLVRTAAMGGNGVSYEVATVGDKTLSRPDIIRALNTELLAGDGPDVLVLDGLPIAQLIETGLLEDLTGVIDTTLYYDTMLNAYTKDGAAYAYPALFQPNIMARKTEQGPPLAALGTMRAIEETLVQSGGSLCFAGYEDVFNTFYQPCTAAMFPGGTSVDEAAVADFLSLTAGILTSPDFVDKSQDELYNMSIEGLDMGVPHSMWLYKLEPTVNYAFGTAQGYGNTTFALGVYHLGGDKQTAPYEIAPMPGNSFVPLCVVAVNANSSNKEAAKAFVASLFEMQTEQMALNLNLKGFLVRRDVESRAHDAENAENAKNGMEDLFAPAASFGLDEVIALLDTPAELNYILQDMVYTEAVALYQGTATVESCTGAILQSTRLYFEEMG